MAKLTLSVVKPAKRSVQQRSAADSTKDQPEPDAPILRSLRGVLKGVDVRDYRKYLEE